LKSFTASNPFGYTLQMFFNDKLAIFELPPVFYSAPQNLFSELMVPNPMENCICYIHKKPHAFLSFPPRKHVAFLLLRHFNEFCSLFCTV